MFSFKSVILAAAMAIGLTSLPSYAVTYCGTGKIISIGMGSSLAPQSKGLPLVNITIEKDDLSQINFTTLYYGDVDSSTSIRQLYQTATAAYMTGANVNLYVYSATCNADYYWVGKNWVTRLSGISFN